MNLCFCYLLFDKLVRKLGFPRCLPIFIKLQAKLFVFVCMHVCMCVYVCVCVCLCVCVHVYVCVNACAALTDVFCTV
jgi:hypothetical protein